MNTATIPHCPGCGAPVLPVGALILDARPDPLGVYRVDGTPMRKGEWLKWWSAERPVGRRVHVCGRPTLAGVGAA